VIGSQPDWILTAMLLFQGLRSQANFSRPALRVLVEAEREEASLQRLQGAETEGGEGRAEIEGQKG